MCGRYTLFAGEKGQELQRLLREIERKSLLSLVPERDLFPSEEAPVYAVLQGKIRLQAMRWGLPNPYRSGLIINARAETASQKKLFRASLHSLRCAVPCSGFYEWDREKRAYRFSAGHSELLYMAGIYSHWDDGARFIILTVPANLSVAPVHDRMPLILPRQSVRTWLCNGERAPYMLQSRGPALTRTAVREQPEEPAPLFSAV